MLKAWVSGSKASPALFLPHAHVWREIWPPEVPITQNGSACTISGAEVEVDSSRLLVVTGGAEISLRYWRWLMAIPTTVTMIEKEFVVTVAPASMMMKMRRRRGEFLVLKIYVYMRMTAKNTVPGLHMLPASAAEAKG